MSTINERIAHYRKLADLTQTDAAEKLGIKCSTYSQMERKGNITAERLLALAEIFHVEPEDILYGDRKEEKPEEDRNTNPDRLHFRQELFYEKESFSAPFIFSKKEENLIKIIRNLSKEDKEEVLKFIEEKYRKK